MIIPKKNRHEICKYLFQEGVLYAKKDYNLAKHPEIDVPNLQVIKLMQSFKSREYVRETFAWQYYYWYLTNDGIEYLRTFLNLPSEIVPATLKKSVRPPTRPFGSGPPGDRPRGPPRFEGDRPRFGDRDGYRGGPRAGPPGDIGDKSGAPPEFQPSFRMYDRDYVWYCKVLGRPVKRVAALGSVPWREKVRKSSVGTLWLVVVDIRVPRQEEPTSSLANNPFPVEENEAAAASKLEGRSEAPVPKSKGEMVNVRSDSPTCRRIVLAFLDFLQSVELAPGVDSEAIDVVRDCLEDVFKLDSSSCEKICPGLLLDLFTSEEIGQHQLRSYLDSAAAEDTSHAKLCSPEAEDSETLEASKGEGSAGGLHGIGAVSRDELFGRFYAGLDKINFFTSSPGGLEDPNRIAKATQLFDEAWIEMGSSQRQVMNLSNFAEIFKSKGNDCIRMKLYSEAIELYTCAIAICEKAVYYSNRAAAYTNIKKYSEAIEDCIKSIEIDPNYSKAYSRLGSAYFAQGNYRDALEKGYLRALELDPNNNTIRENIQVTEKKLMEQQAETDQNRRSYHGQGSNTRSAGSTNNSFPFASFPMGAPTPEFVANIFRSMAPGHGQDSSSQASMPANSSPLFTSFPMNSSVPADFANIHVNMDSDTRENSGNLGESSEPEVRIDANASLNFGGGLEQVSDALRSVVGMLSSQFAPHADTPGEQTHGSHQ
ncbi:40S ribosomal protein S10 [Musa troglodytarum]|uniref:40S ribosomal protein S10 n=2 Tax=Musa troglodytarum TaxID=320322 RepID=A0A9E7HTP2_9LILI|nr:40S ribosomal protein S10 [Musa troglodytarum]